MRELKLEFHEKTEEFFTLEVSSQISGMDITMRMDWAMKTLWVEARRSAWLAKRSGSLGRNQGRLQKMSDDMMKSRIS